MQEHNNNHTTGKMFIAGKYIWLLNLLDIYVNVNLFPVN